MSDLISRQAAIDSVLATGYADQIKENILLILRLLPPAQREIIMCKECKHCEHWYADKGRCFLWHEGGIDVFEEGFCNYAERREPMDDLISRQAAIEAFYKHPNIGWTTLDVLSKIKALPSAERKRGEWLHKKITNDYHVTGQCSNCYERRRIDNFCPNCGADMRGKEDE